MKHKLVIYYPLLVLVFIVSWSVSNALAVNNIHLPLPSFISQWLQSNEVTSSMQRYVKYIEQDELVPIFNRQRQTAGLNQVSIDPVLCQQFSSEKAEDYSFSSCEGCIHAALLKISSKIPAAMAEGYLSENASIQDVVLNEKLEHACIREDESMFTVFMFGMQDEAEPVTEVRTNMETVQPIRVTPKAKNFSEDELWNALTDYRKSHQRNDLTKDENLCQYARKRVDDHIEDLSTKDPEEYPNPAKYPLDAHQGFSEDADTGYAFDVTGKNRLAENLAYWPSAEYATHIIEWGWDSSTEGHKETQLSEEYGSACIAGQDGFYVAIFGN